MSNNFPIFSIPYCILVNEILKNEKKNLSNLFYKTQHNSNVLKIFWVQIQSSPGEKKMYDNNISLF